MGGGAAGSGAATDAGADAGLDAGLDGGGDAGAEVDAGDTRHLIGERCDLGLEEALVTSCRVEPFNPFQSRACLAIRLEDGGVLPQAALAAYLELGRAESCAFFGAAQLRCVASSFPACVAARADGGTADRVLQAALDTCSSGLGRRFEDACIDSCTALATRCGHACDVSSLEVCADCSAGCGREFIGCARRCLLLPDAGYPDAGP